MRTLHRRLQAWIFWIVVSCLAATGMAQVAGTPIPARPDKYYHPYQGMNLGATKDRARYAIDWIVYSSKENNPIYSDPMLVHPIANAGFMQAFFATHIETENAIQVVRFDMDEMDAKGRRFAAHTQALGWMPKSSLILWQTALVDPVSKFARKVMTCTTPNLLKQDFAAAQLGERKILFYNSPSLKSPNNKDSRIYEIFFVFAETDNALLLSKSQIISPGTANTSVLGWVDKDRVTDWSQRLALEPNWDPEAVEERKRKGVEILALKDPVAAASYQYGRGVTEAQTIWTGGYYEHRNIAAWKRFSILSQSASGVAEVVVVSDVLSSSGQVVSAEKFAEIERQYNVVRDQRRQINLVFVIDGTHSMESYYPSIANGIQNCMNLVRTSDNVFKFGAVVYRDYPEESCNRLIEQKGLVDIEHLESLGNWIKSIDTKDCKDRDKPEAMYHGLSMGLRMIGDDTKASNLIILIGDTGNRIPDERHQPKEIIQSLAAKRCGLMAFQVWNADDPTYDHFIDQTMGLILGSSKLAAQNYQSIDVKAYEPVCVDAGGKGFRMKNSPIPGAIYFADRGGRLLPAQLQQGIMDIIQETNETNEKLLSFLEYHIKGNNYRPAIKTTDGDNFTPAILMYLKDMGLDKEQLDLLVKNNVQFAIKSYVPIEMEGLEYPLYKYVLFVDDTELYELMHTISQFLSPLDPKYTVRQNLKNVCREILRLHYGTDRKLVENKSLAEVLSLVTGLPSQSKLLREIKPDDIDDPRKVTDRQMSELAAYIAQKKQTLEKILHDNDYFFRSNDHSYYWLPQEFLP